MLAVWKEKRNRCNKWKFSGIKAERTHFLHVFMPLTPVRSGQSISQSRIVIHTQCTSRMGIPRTFPVSLLLTWIGRTNKHVCGFLRFHLHYEQVAISIWVVHIDCELHFQHSIDFPFSHAMKLLRLIRNITLSFSIISSLLMLYFAVAICTTCVCFYWLELCYDYWLQ
jgi:hypothetical protein